MLSERTKTLDEDDRVFINNLIRLEQKVHTLDTDHDDSFSGLFILAGDAKSTFREILEIVYLKKPAEEKEEQAYHHRADIQQIRKLFHKIERNRNVRNLLKSFLTPEIIKEFPPIRDFIPLTMMSYDDPELLIVSESKKDVPEDDTHSLAHAFKLIYKGLRDGKSQSSTFKTNFLATHAELKDSELLNEIRNYVAIYPNSRTAKAWELATQHHKNCHNENIPLFFEMYKYAFGASGFFKKSQIWKNAQNKTITFFKASSFNTEVIQFTAEEMAYAKAHAGTRSHTIINSLPVPTPKPRTFTIPKLGCPV